MITDQSGGDQVRAAIRSAVGAVLPELEAAARRAASQILRRG